MAYSYHHSNSSLFLIALLLTLQLSPQVVHGQKFLRSRGVRASGRLCCTRTGNCPPFGSGRPTPRTTVILICNTTSGVLVASGLGTTDANGRFAITAIENSSQKPGIYTGRCFVEVVLPVRATDCRVLSTITDLLTSSLRFVGTTKVKEGVRVDNSTIVEWVRGPRI